RRRRPRIRPRPTRRPPRPARQAPPPRQPRHRPRDPHRPGQPAPAGHAHPRRRELPRHRRGPHPHGPRRPHPPARRADPSRPRPGRHGRTGRPLMPRHLAVVDTTHAPAATAPSAAPRVLARITPTGRLPELTADHDQACDAAAMPDVAHELRVHARRTATALGLNPDDTTILARLLDLARGSYVHGHMDAAADQPDTAPNAPLATVLHLRGG